jgi:GAF domain-containing protein
VDIQFAISRTLVFGVVSTLVVVFLAVLHWLFGRMIEHSGLAFSLEGLAAIGLGLVLHRTSHGITLLVDRVLFRKHHQAEERLRRVTAALPFASDERAIAEALVTEPARNLELASAALFYRESGEGPLNRVLAQGWNESHVASLEADSLLVRYLQAEHDPLKLDDSQLLPAGVPEDAALPVLAIPIVNQHVLVAVVLYGSHTNHTLLDPDEIELLHQLAKAAAVSHQQVRIAMLQREVAALTSENTVEKARNEQLEASAAGLRALVRDRITNGA